MNADQLAQVFGQLDLMVVGPPEQEFAPNVNVVANGLTELPAANDLDRPEDHQRRLKGTGCGSPTLRGARSSGKTARSRVRSRRPGGKICKESGSVVRAVELY